MILLEIIKWILIIDLISFVGLIILLRDEIFSIIKEQRKEKRRQIEEENKLRKIMKLNEFGGWEYDVKKDISC